MVEITKLKLVTEALKKALKLTLMRMIRKKGVRHGLNAVK